MYENYNRCLRGLGFRVTCSKLRNESFPGGFLKQCFAQTPLPRNEDAGIGQSHPQDHATPPDVPARRNL